MQSNLTGWPQVNTNLLQKLHLTTLVLLVNFWVHGESTNIAHEEECGWWLYFNLDFDCRLYCIILIATYLKSLLFRKYFVDKLTNKWTYTCFVKTMFNVFTISGIWIETKMANKSKGCKSTIEWVKIKDKRALALTISKCFLKKIYQSSFR